MLIQGLPKDMVMAFRPPVVIVEVTSMVTEALHAGITYGVYGISTGSAGSRYGIYG